MKEEETVAIRKPRVSGTSADLLRELDRMKGELQRHGTAALFVKGNGEREPDIELQLNSEDADFGPAVVEW